MPEKENYRVLKRKVCGCIHVWKSAICGIVPSTDNQFDVLWEGPAKDADDAQAQYVKTLNS